LTLEADKITMQAANTDIENETVERDNMSKEVLLDLVREARAMNETEVQRRMLTSRRQNVILGMGVLQDSRNLFELTDDELLSAFALVKK
ncbi:unnamed protein product, partial [Onchocerca ochengi]